jgi:hypothetical protein
MTKKKKVTTTVTTTVTEEIISSNEKTQIICILDRSGSMSENGIIYEAINGFNDFLKKQRELKDKATLTVALFDDQYELLYDDVDIKEVPDITYDTWKPRGLTALFDAIGKTINTVKANHMKLGSEKPDKVLVCIVTDGKENASKEYINKGDVIKKLIKECENEGWNFIYLAANQDAFDVGSSFGISHGNTYTFTTTTTGIYAMSMTLNDAAVSYRSMSTRDVGYQKKAKNLIANLGKQDMNNEPQNSNNNIVTGTVTGNVTFDSDNVTFDSYNVTFDENNMSHT